MEHDLLSVQLMENNVSERFIDADKAFDKVYTFIRTELTQHTMYRFVRTK